MVDKNLVFASLLGATAVGNAYLSLDRLLTAANEKMLILESQFKPEIAESFRAAGESLAQNYVAHRAEGIIFAVIAGFVGAVSVYNATKKNNE